MRGSGAGAEPAAVTQQRLRCLLVETRLGRRVVDWSFRLRFESRFHSQAVSTSQARCPHRLLITTPAPYTVDQ